ncbi:MAG: spo0J [Herbinix sp.]|jgi:ParB family chromosome partitioning protein|nr:spo0J [Herbinix sp.]
MAVKKGLGKGLDIMIPEQIVNKNEEKSEDVSRETLVHISQIEPNKSQPRKKFDEDTLQELADSIKQYGVIQPLILQKREKFYEIIAGERRWRAARMAGLKEVPAIIKDYSPQEIVEIALIENIQREDLNPIEEALTYHRLIQDFNLKQDEVAERVSKSRVAVTNAMRLLKLDIKVQQMLIDDMLSSGHARALLSLENSELQYNIACRVFDEKLSVRETEKLVKNLLNEKPKKEIAATDEVDYIYRSLEDKIRTIIGTKVLIHNKKNDKGSIEIEYYSKEELEKIIDVFESFQQ